MPEISRFYGIVVLLYFRDHNPPHIHARYAEREAMIGIRDRAVLEGNLPARALAFVNEWATLHQDELVEAWERAKRGEAPGKIAPLD